MYDTLRQTFYWPNMFGDIKKYVAKCGECAKVKDKIRKHNAKLKLFPETNLLDDLAMDFVDPFPKNSMERGLFW